MLHKKVRAGIVPITIRNQVHLMLRRWQLFGPKDVMQYFASRAFGWGRRKPNGSAPIPVCPAPVDYSTIDRHFGIEPDAPVPDPKHRASGKWGVLYERSSETIFREVMEKLPIDFENYTFIDLGAGKGFVLCLAAQYPFKRIIGVEYSGTLAAMATENLAHFAVDSRTCANVACVLDDAAEFVFPPEPTVLYLFNPFQAKVMDRMLANLKQSLREHPRDLWIFYANPWEHRKFKRSREFQVEKLTWDYALYHFQPAN